MTKKRSQRKSKKSDVQECVELRARQKRLLLEVPLRSAMAIEMLLCRGSIIANAAVVPLCLNSSRKRCPLIEDDLERPGKREVYVGRKERAAP